MIITDNEIRKRMKSAEPLFTGADDASIVNCGYVLRAGRVFEAKSGKEDLLNPAPVTPFGKLAARLWPPKRKRSVVWEIGPSETLIVMTEESIHMPADLCASYTPLNRLATKGVMLLNSAVVEPGYSGPLSCFLLNFSSKPISIGPQEAIAKIVFHTLDKSLANLKPETVGTEQYARNLAQSATSYQKSFLDIAGIEDRASEKAKSSIKGWVIGGGVMVSILILVASIEPLISHWIWERTGVTTTTQRVEDAKLLRDLIAAQENSKLQMEQLKLQSEKSSLEKRIEEMKQEVEQLKTRARRPSRK